MRANIVTALVALALVCWSGVKVSAEDSPHGKLAWDCADCHTTTGWKHLADDMKFSHRETGFRLGGAHRGVACQSCHQETTFSHVGTACADCHADHHLGQLGSDCQNCHVTRNWQPQSDMLAQHAERGFPLTGVHAVADCEACHLSSDRQEFAGTPTDCESCHRVDMLSANDPNHSAGAFSVDCRNCHHAAFGSWERTTYEHPGTFPLTGAHLVIDCNGCHAETFAGTPGDCYSCHADEYQGTTDPDHALAAFPTDCNPCHTTSAWLPGRFDHSLTAFRIDGAHTGLDCSSCHQTQYTGTPTDCYSCHTDDYQGTSDPDHALAAFSTNCEDCHTTSAWLPGSFAHASTGFILDGSHLGLNCNSCHQTTYAGTPTDCFACHQTNYEATTNPNHAAALFPTLCESCHTTSGWTPADWDHDGQYFPIYSGAHREKWTDCTECHTVPSNFSTFDCTACHEHNATDMNAKHSQVQNYQYSSSACYDCHPTGQH